MATTIRGTMPPDSIETVVSNDEKLLSRLIGEVEEVYSALHSALSRCRTPYLLDSKWKSSLSDTILSNGDVNTCIDELDWTPLHVAVQCGDSELVDWLLNRGANPNLLHKADWSPLHLAIHLGHQEIIDSLIKNGGDRNAFDEVKEKALPLLLWVKETEDAYTQQSLALHIWSAFKNGRNSLEMKNCNLNSLPAEIKLLKYIGRIELQNNHLTRLPRELAELPNLGGFYLSNNQLTAEGLNIPPLASATIIHLDGNQLTSLPSWFEKLEDLWRLDITRNQFPVEETSNITARLSHLKILKLDDKPPEE